MPDESSQAQVVPEPQDECFFPGGTGPIQENLQYVHSWFMKLVGGLPQIPDTVLTQRFCYRVYWGIDISGFWCRVRASMFFKYEGFILEKSTKEQLVEFEKKLRGGDGRIRWDWTDKTGDRLYVKLLHPTSNWPYISETLVVWEREVPSIPDGLVKEGMALSERRKKHNEVLGILLDCGKLLSPKGQTYASAISSARSKLGKALSLARSARVELLSPEEEAHEARLLSWLKVPQGLRGAV